MKDKVLKYLKEKGTGFDEKFIMDYLDKGIDITDKDELMHEFPAYPEHHNESWYFNFIDFNANVHMVARIGFEMGKKRAVTMLLLVADGKSIPYLDVLPLEKMPDKIGRKKLSFECIEPFKKWRITAKHRKFEIDVISEARFPVFNYMDGEDPIELLEKFGVEMLDVAAQFHYEQGMKITGEVILKKKDETGKKIQEVRKINCLGHRDHSWGTRDWVNIDKWNWISAQFDDRTINIARVEVFNKIIHSGFVSTKEKNVLVKKVDVDTTFGYKNDPKCPASSKFTIETSEETFELVSKTQKSLDLKRPSENGLTQIYEQIVKFEMGDKIGTGISEYMMSIKNK
ncbi:MAG: DUF7064 domain-containing protein [Candidatus Helarchaeota archaeon]